MCSPGATHPVDRKFVNYYAGGSAELMQTTSRVLAESPRAIAPHLVLKTCLPIVQISVFRCFPCSLVSFRVLALTDFLGTHFRVLKYFAGAEPHSTSIT